MTYSHPIRVVIFRQMPSKVVGLCFNCRKSQLPASNHAPPNLASEKGPAIANHDALPKHPIEPTSRSLFIAGPQKFPTLGEMVYPTKEELREWFRLQETGESPKFFDLYVRDDVVWTVEVSNCAGRAYLRERHPLAGCIMARRTFWQEQ
jgi:hypothetical protein